MDLTVVISSFGDQSWRELALQRAVPSLDGWGQVVLYHTTETHLSIGEVRNAAVAAGNPEGWILFLDPDDELAVGYIDAMTDAAVEPSDLYVPALQLITGGKTGPARVLDDRDIVDGLNPCPIGTLIHRSTFDRVGGFWNERAWEDWSLFRRVVLTGGELRFVPDAVYRAHVSTVGRNSTVRNPKALRREIVASHRRWLKELP